VYGVHSQSLCEAALVDLAISAHISDLLRSQVGPSMFHYPSCPPGASSSLGVVVWVRGQLGLVAQEWHRARVKASRLITALELELRPNSDRKMLEDLYGPAGVISARVSLRPRSLRLDFPRNAPHRQCNLQPPVLDDLAAPDGPFLTLINDGPPDLVVAPTWPSAAPSHAVPLVTSSPRVPVLCGSLEAIGFSSVTPAPLAAASGGEDSPLDSPKLLPLSLDPSAHRTLREGGVAIDPTSSASPASCAPPATSDGGVIDAPSRSAVNASSVEPADAGTLAAPAD
jgi:hypothetical protein